MAIASAQSWRELLVDLKARGLAMAPELAIADGALGFWAALREVFGQTPAQRCWVHKTANVLNKMANSVQPKAKEDLQNILIAGSRQDAEKYSKYVAKYDKAGACLKKDREALLTIYDFPAEHWKQSGPQTPLKALSPYATAQSALHRLVVPLEAQRLALLVDMGVEEVEDVAGIKRRCVLGQAAGTLRWPTILTPCLMTTLPGSVSAQLPPASAAGVDDHRPRPHALHAIDHRLATGEIVLGR